MNNPSDTGHPMKIKIVGLHFFLLYSHTFNFFFNVVASNCLLPVRSRSPFVTDPNCIFVQYLAEVIGQGNTLFN